MFYRFADPEYLFLLIALPFFVLWYWKWRVRKVATVRYSSLELVLPAVRSGTSRLRHLMFVIRTLALAALIVAFARPQTGVSGEEVISEGIDIVLVLDLSSSMLAEDLTPTRVAAAKQVAASFVEGRRNDRIGLVVFAGQAFTQAPLTLDYNVLMSLLGELEVGMIAEDGTAIGMGLATAVKRLQESEAESKVIILLTDGRNNRGEIDPVTAAQMAQALDIKVYAIGAGTRGEAPITIDDPTFGRRRMRMRVDVDEPTLRAVAEQTGGRFFRATDRQSLEEIYREIDELETTEVEVEHYTHYGELFHFPLAIGLLLVVLEVGMGNTVLRKIP
jgi:Ca-activated chloride channel family protein